MTTLEISAAEFVKRFQAGEIPANARVTVTFESDVKEEDPAVELAQQWPSEMVLLSDADGAFA